MGRKKKQVTEVATPSPSPTQTVDSRISDLNDLFMHTGERLIRIEDWQKEVVYKMGHYDDLDAILADTNKSVEELSKWKDRQVLDAWGRKNQQPSPAVEVKNQDVAKLQGLLDTYIEKVDTLADRLLNIERKYIFPESFKASKSNVVLESITAIEDTARKQKEQMSKLDGENKRLRIEMDAVARDLERPKTVNTTSQSSS